MSTTLILVCLIGYFVVLSIISRITGKGATNQTYFKANNSSPWYLVAFGMIGASLSGVTFISVPGWVEKGQFSYMQMVLGYIPGYLIIAFVLMPMYYRLKLTSIYSYLDNRFGRLSYKTGSAFFLLSRLAGSALRMYLVVNVLQFMLFDELGIRFEYTVIISVLLIWLYTFKGGIKTIVWTDTLQTAFMLLAVSFTLVLIGQEMDLGIGGMIDRIQESDYSRAFFFSDGMSAKSFPKMFLSGILIAVVMTGMDQDMMQKNLTCRNIKEAQWNMVSFSVVLIFVNLLFLGLGVMLHEYSALNGLAIPENGDDLYSGVVKAGLLPTAVGIFFILGLVAAAYSSADSALTALTTAFSIDFLQIGNRPEKKQEGLRMKVHIMFSILMVIVIIITRQFHDDSLVDTVFKVASYTYGPLLGLFAFGLAFKMRINDNWVPFICILAPVISFTINMNSNEWFNGYSFGYEILLVNGLLTWLGLFLSRLSLKKVS